MIDFTVKKVIARDGEREIIESSASEMYNFLTYMIRPDFRDTNTICVKFLKYYGEEDDCPDESSWYINPYYCNFKRFKSSLLDDCLYNGPKMNPDFVPEILLINFRDIHEVIEKYDLFNAQLSPAKQTTLTDEEKYELFLLCYLNLD